MSLALFVPDPDGNELDDEWQILGAPVIPLLLISSSRHDTRVLQVYTQLNPRYTPRAAM